MLAITVDSLQDNVTTDDGLTTLREAIQAANATPGADEITFHPTLTEATPATIVLSLGQLTINGDVSIIGPGASHLTIDAGGDSRIFNIGISADVTIRGVAMTGGHSSVGQNYGGAIQNSGDLLLESVVLSGNHSDDYGGAIRTTGTLRIVDSTLSNNSASIGGGAVSMNSGSPDALIIERSAVIHNSAKSDGALRISGGSGGGTALVINSTISGNKAKVNAAAIQLNAAAVLTVINSTITDNHADTDTTDGITGEGGGIRVSGASVTLHNTILAGNTAGLESKSDIAAGALQNTSSYNLLGIAVPLPTGAGNYRLALNESIGLAPLDHYGGTTHTHALLENSPAIDKGDNAVATGLSADQRGLTRLVDNVWVPNVGSNTIDIGAFERHMPKATGDFDGDGKLEEAFFDTFTRSIYVAGTRSGRLHISKWADVGTPLVNGWQVGDFDGDGRDDLAYRGATTHAWSIAFSDATRFVISPTGLSGHSWSMTLVGDFDGDGADELLGRYDAGAGGSGSWELIDSNTSRNFSTYEIGAALASVSAFPQIHVGDVNGDGIDDLVAYNGSAWHAALTSLGPGGQAQLSGSTNVQTWFVPGWAHSAGLPTETVNVEGPYQKLLNVFSEVYNTIELELYPGLMKGIQATAETKAGNPWDQAALLVERLDSAGFHSKIVYGTIDAQLDDMRQWLGLLPNSSPQAVANVVKTALDANAAISGTSLRFKHAWVQVNVPTPTGMMPVNLDPSWKFKDRQPGEAINLANAVSGYAPPNFGIAGRSTRGTFDEFGYLADAAENQLPIEWYEDQLMNYLVATGKNKSLAEVAYDGPIVQRTFEQLSGALAVLFGNKTIVTPQTSLETFDNLNHVVNAYAARFVHQATISFAHDLASGGTSQTHWTQTIAIPEDALSSIGITYLKIENSPSTPNDDAYRARLLLNGDVVKESSGAAETLNIGDKARIRVQHQSPSEFGISISSNVADLTYRRDPGQVHAIAFDANQVSWVHLVRLQASLNGLLADGDDVPDIDELLNYTIAKYWYDFNRSNETIDSLLRTIGVQQWVGSGIVSADSLLLEIPEEANPYLQFPIVPHDMGIDLPNSNHISLTVDGAQSNTEAFQLAGWNASSLENAVVEEVINNRSVSTIRGLLNAFRNAPDTNVQSVTTAVRVLEAYTEGGVRRVYLRGNIGVFSVGSAYSPTGDSQITSEQELRDLLFHHKVVGSNNDAPEDNPAAHALWEILYGVGGEAPTDHVTVLVPHTQSLVGTVEDGWKGAVWVAETQLTDGSQSGQYTILPIGGGPTQGGYSSNVISPRNQALPTASFDFNPYAGDPVNVANGNMFRDETDIVYANVGVPLNFARHYDSQSKFDIGLGVGWVHSFSDRLLQKPGEPNTIEWLTSSGSLLKFTKADGVWQPPESRFGKLTETGTAFVWKGADGIEYHFKKVTAATAGEGKNYIARLEKILDRDGHGVLLTYPTSDSFTISAVRDAHSIYRRLTFTYNASNHIAIVKRVVPDLSDVIWTYTYDMSDDRLASVASPTGAYLTTPRTVQYKYHTTGHALGLMSKITEPDGGYHKYEYYANGRVFRVVESVDIGIPFLDADDITTSHTFNYNLFRALTEFTDENGNVETYLHDDKGQLLRQVHDDRSRLIYEYGPAESSESALMTKAVDERGAVETFDYYQLGETGYSGRLGELQSHTAKDSVVTNFEYWTSSNSQYDHISEISKTTVDPSGSAPVTTALTRDSLGHVLSTTDALGNITQYAYYGTSDAAHLRGLRKSEIRPAGVGDAAPEAATWQVLEESFTVSGNTLSVRLHKTASGQSVSADAIRIDRLDADGIVTRIIDNDTPGFRRSHASGFSIAQFGGQLRYGPDALIMNAAGARHATWIFTDLDPGTYRVSASRIYSTGLDSAAKYELFDGQPGPEAEATVFADQTVPTGDFRNYETVFEYDIAGNVTRTITEGVQEGFTLYDHFGKVIANTDATYVDSFAISDVLGRSVRSGLSDPDGAGPLAELSSTFAYDPMGRLIAETDALGRVTSSQYDAKGRLIGQTFADEANVSYEYDGKGNRTSATDELGRTTRFVYDSRDRLIQTIHPDGAIELIQYDGSGNIVATTDALGRRTEFTYDKAGRLLSTKSAVGTADATTIVNKYNALGRLMETVDANGVITQYKHDTLGRVVQSTVLDRQHVAANGNTPTTPDTTRPPVHVSTIEYDTNGRAIKTIVYDASKFASFQYAILIHNPESLLASSAAKTQVTENRFDAFDRLVKAAYDDGTTSRIIYDAAGRVRYEFDELGRRTEAKYDKYGRLAEAVAPDPDGPMSVQSSPVTKYQYDAVGNVMAMIDPRGFTTNYEYDARNRLATTTRPDASRLENIYGITGQLVGFIDAKGYATHNKYDDRGRVIQRWQSDPDGGGSQIAPVTIHAYDAVGNVIVTIDPLGSATWFKYDALNRLKEESYHQTIVADDVEGGDAVFSGSEGVQTWLDNAAYGGDATTWDTSAPLPRFGEWTFANLETGTYRIATTWIADFFNDPEARVRIKKNGQYLESFARDGVIASQFTKIDQSRSPEDFDSVHGESRHWWEIVADGITVATGDELSVVISWSGTVDTYLVVDAVRLDRVVSNVYEYDKNGNLTTETDTRGFAANYAYDALNRQISVKLADPDGTGGLGRLETQYSYDGYGNVSAKVEKRNPNSSTDDRVTVYTYDDRNRPYEERFNDTGPDDEELVTTYGYDAVGNTTFVIDPLGVTTFYRYDGLDRLVDEYQDLGEGGVSVGPQALSNPQAIDPYFDGSVQLSAGGTTVTLSGNAWHTMTLANSYHATHRTVLEFTLLPEQLGEVHAIAFDTDGTFDEINWEDEYKRYFELGGWSSLFYAHAEFRQDQNGYLWFHIPIGQYLTDAEKASGIDITHLALVSYDMRPNLEPADQPKSIFSDIRLYESDEVRTVRAYDAAGNLESVRAASDPRNITTRYEHDALGRQTKKVLDANGPLERVFTTTYDANGNVVVERNETSGTQTIYGYDPLNRLVKTTLPDPDGSAASPNGLVATFAYDVVGNLIRQTNGEGESTLTEYDNRGRVVSETDGNGHQTHFRYDSAGNLRSVIDAEGNVTNYTYDGLGRLKTETNAFGTQTHVYDNAGNLERLNDRNGRQRQFFYDSLDRKTKEYWRTGGNGTAVARVLAWEYDRLGRVTKEVAGTFGSASPYNTSYVNDLVNTYEYDGLGRLVAAANYDAGDLAHGTNVGLPKVRQTYEYLFTDYGYGFGERVKRTQWRRDAAGALAAIGVTSRFSNRHGELSDVSDSDADPFAGPEIEWKQFNFYYDVSGRLDVTTWYNNYDGAAWQDVGTTDYRYDQAGRLQRIDYYNDASMASNTIYTYGYDNASRVTSFNSSSVADIARSYTYDDAGQLIFRGGEPDPLAGEVYAYDSNGNRVGTKNYAPASFAPHTIGPGNRLLSDPHYTYTYDNEGRLTSRTRTSTDPADDHQSEYSWNHRGQLTKVTFKNNGGTVIQSIDYTYDLGGRRVKRAHDANGEASGGVTNEYFVYDGDELAMTFSHAGQLNHRYLYGPQTDQVLMDEVFTASGQTDEVLRLIGDHQHTVREVFDDTGTYRKHIQYDAFGQITHESFYDKSEHLITDPSAHAEAIDQLFYYTGRELDEAAGLQQNRARWYDPTTGRFLSEDPLGFAAGDANLYRYAANNPVTNTDPTGLRTLKPYETLPALRSTNPYSTVSYSTPSHTTPSVPTVDQSLRQLTMPKSFDYYDTLARQVGPRPNDVTAVQTITSPVYGDVPRSAGPTLTNFIQTTESPVAAGVAQFVKPIASLAGHVAGGLIDAALPPSDPSYLVTHRDGTKTYSMGEGPSTGHLAGQATLLAAPVLGSAARPAGTLGTGRIAPSTVAQQARGGTYVLRDAETGQVMRAGRTGDLAARELQHHRHPVTGKYDFDAIHRTDNYAAQRGLEQELHWQHNPPLDKIRPIDPKNPNLLDYLRAANDYLDGLGQ